LASFEVNFNIYFTQIFLKTYNNFEKFTIQYRKLLYVERKILLGKGEIRLDDFFEEIIERAHYY